MQQLRGATIAAPERITLVAMLGQRLLREQGLEAGRDFTLQWTSSHGNAALAVLRGDAQAGIIGILPLKQLPESVSRQLRVLTLSPSLRSQMLLTHPRLPPEETRRIREALLRFEQEEAGRKFFQSSGLGGFDALTVEDIKAFEPYAAEVRRALDASR